MKLTIRRTRLFEGTDIEKGGHVGNQIIGKDTCRVVVALSWGGGAVRITRTMYHRRRGLPWPEHRPRGNDLESWWRQCYSCFVVVVVVIIEIIHVKIEIVVVHGEE